MSRRSKIYTERDWQAADPLDRLYIHLLEPQRWPLNNVEEERLERLRKVWAIMCEKATHRERMALISKQVDVTERTIHRDINDATQLFGDILKFDTDLELRLAYDRYMDLYELASKEKDYDTARRCHDSALAVLEKIELRAPKTRKKYAEIVFTSDPAALRARNQEEGEEIEFDEIDGQSILEREAVGIPAGH